jgi:CheY-like chemotaxis protein
VRKYRILVVEDDQKTATYLKSYFEWQGYEVLAAANGREALDVCRLKLPNAVILDIMMPDMSGYEVCRILRGNNRTSYVPIIFVSHRNQRRDIVAAFEAGADDYVVKPFDVEELRLRVEGVIRYSRRGVLLHPITNLPGGELIVEQLKAIKDIPDPWTLLYFDLKHFGVFKAISDADTVNTVLVRLSDILRDTVEQYGAPNDFVGQTSDDGFVVITIPETARVVGSTVIERFNAHGLVVGQTTGLLNLTVSLVSSYDGPFTDIRQIGQALAALQDGNEPGGLAWWPGDELHTGDIDYYRQLSQQAVLWQTKPELAQILVEVGRLIMARLPDISRGGMMLGAAAQTNLPPDTLKMLRRQQELCGLAAQNLDYLPCKIRRYQKFEPTPIGWALTDVINLWPEADVDFVWPESGSEILVDFPADDLRQLFYDLFRWLHVDALPGLRVSLTTNEEFAVVLFNSRPMPAIQMETVFEVFHRNEAGAVYGYLARKILARYGGQIEGKADSITVKLPLADFFKPAESVDALRKKIREQRLFVNEQKNRLVAADIFDKATELVDPLADDLLTAVESMLATIQTSPSIDPQLYPWPSIQHNLRFVRLLTLELRKNRSLIPAPINLKSLLETVKPLVAHRVLDHSVAIECSSARPVITSDQTRLLQIFVNLALNALEAMPADGHLTFSVTVNGYYTIDVRDNGRGIAPDSLPHIFDPHFSTKGEGRGAGLYHVKTYLQQLHGDVEVFSTIGQGTTFRVKLPPVWGAGYF